MKNLLFLLTLFSFSAQAGLPPATSKGSSDTSSPVTFNTVYDFPLTHAGTTATAYVSSISGAKNYLSPIHTSNGANSGNGNFEQGSTTGWSLAHTTLSAALFPTSTATAGSAFSSSSGGTAAAAGLTLTAVTSGALEKKYSGQLASSGASTAGDMVLTSAFYVDKSDQSAPLTITLSTSVTVGASGLNFSGTSSNSFAIYAYDVTGATWIQPSGVFGMVSNGVYNVKNVVFQPQSNTSTQYQIAIININASSGAYTMLLDAVGVGPQAAVSAPAMSDSVSYTANTNGMGGVTAAVNYRRVGETLELSGNLTTGTTTAAQAQVNLPVGLSIDGTKIGTNAVCGTAAASTQGANVNFPVLANSGNTYIQFGAMAASSSTGLSPQLGNSLLSNSVGFNFFCKVPIVGWSSNTVSSADTDTRVVAARAYASSAVTPGTSQVNYDTVSYDSSGGITTGATWKFTASGAGTYEVDLVSQASTASGGNLVLFKNGVAYSPLTSLATGYANTTMSSGTQVPMISGDFIDVRPDTTGSTLTNTTTGTGPRNSISIKRLSGPAVVQATETVSGVYYGTPSTAALNSSYNTITFPNKSVDDHNAYSGGTLTIPSPGKYSFSVATPIGGTYSVNQNANISIFINGVETFTNAQLCTNATVAKIFSNVSVQSVPLHQGDLVTVRLLTQATSPSLPGGNVDSFFSWARVGN